MMPAVAKHLRSLADALAQARSEQDTWQAIGALMKLRGPRDRTIHDACWELISNEYAAAKNGADKRLVSAAELAVHDLRVSAFFGAQATWEAAGRPRLNELLSDMEPVNDAL